eukprot:2467270-Rhodomonas_salina.1
MDGSAVPESLGDEADNLINRSSYVDGLLRDVWESNKEWIQVYIGLPARGGSLFRSYPGSVREGGVARLLPRCAAHCNCCALEVLRYAIRAPHISSRLRNERSRWLGCHHPAPAPCAGFRGIGDPHWLHRVSQKLTKTV